MLLGILFLIPYVFFIFSYSGKFFIPLVISAILFLVGSILPDSDSNDKSSLIFVFIQDTANKISRDKYLKAKKWNEGHILLAVGYCILVLFGILIWPIAIITNKLEILIIKYTGRIREHKQSLHTIYGIMFISILWAIVFYILYLYFSVNRFNLGIPLLWFASLFLGQLFHLIEDLIVDFHRGWRIKWK